MDALTKVRCRILDESSGAPVAGVVTSLFVEVSGGTNSRFPVGTLCTDSTGYVSFDARSVGLGQPATGYFISAPEVGLRYFDLLGSIAPDRVPSPDRDDVGEGDDTGPEEPLFPPEVVIRQEANGRPACIVFPVYVAGHLRAQNRQGSESCQPMRLPSVQSPDLCDYEVSPFSFVTPASISLGNDCCAIPLPSSHPVQQYRFYNVVAHVDKSVDATPAPPPQNHLVDLSSELDVREPMIKFGEILEYRQDWHSLGHSLGELKYSLPLAPGESTQIAVIDWSRDDVARRQDGVRATEFLDHDVRRDRSIEETIDAALREEQGGNSHMGSTSGTASGSQYVTWTGNHAFGGGISYSYGNRDLDADSLQDLHDRVRQASSSVRSLNSTVIVQGSQDEKSALSSRRVANHNHCHAVTIQYYEVLRQYRVATTFAGRRDAVLVPFALFPFTLDVALRFRTALTQALRDPSLAACFEALVRLRLYGTSPEIYDPPPPTASPPDTLTPPRAQKTVRVTGTAQDEAGVDTGIRVRAGDSIVVSASGLLAADSGSSHGQGGFEPDGDGLGNAPGMPGENPGNFPFVAPGRPMYALLYKVGAATPRWSTAGSSISFVAANDGSLLFCQNAMHGRFPDREFARATHWTVNVDYPTHDEPPSPDDASEPGAAVDGAPGYRLIDDQLCRARLIGHLNANQGFYNSAIWMLTDAVERRLYLERALQSRPEILAGISDRPMAISGNYVAFAYRGLRDASGGLPPVEGPPVEDIVTLPTRGLFAEAEMGRCNSCEERDATRMWDWTQMTVETPPEISGITPGPKGVAPSITPLQLPSAVVQITQPPSAPDPTGLANALNLLKTPEIFRDMAGLAEVSQLLGELAKAAGDANSKALALKAKEKIDTMDKSGGGSTGETSSSGISAADAADRFSLLPEIKTFAEDIGLDPEEYKEFALHQAYGTKPAPKASAAAPLPVKLSPLSATVGGRSISPSELQVGDIIVSTTAAADSLAIRLATRSPVSHAGFYVGNPDRVVEALATGVVEHSLGVALADDTLAVAFRVRNLAAGQAQLAANFAVSEVGKSYDFWSAFTAGVPWWGPFVSSALQGPMLRMIDLGKPDSRYFCSELVIESFKKAGRILTNVPSDELLPADVRLLDVDYVGHLR